jgi:hypothetical protein
MRFVSIGIILAWLLDAGAAVACSPAPSCWIEEGPTYLKSVCREAVQNSDTLKYVDEPDQIGRFVKACAKLHICGQATNAEEGSMTRRCGDCQLCAAAC